jgi:molybdenum cofactor cytidylyltransferase
MLLWAVYIKGRSAEMKLAEHSIGVVVLAAGRGVRMGSRPKLLLPLREDKPIIWHTVSLAASLEPSDIVVVMRPDMPDLHLAIGDLPARCVVNPRFEEGIGTSIASGVASLDESTQAALIMLGDEPEVSPAVVEELVEAYVREGRLATLPLYGKEVGPPSLFSRVLFPELMSLQGDKGGRQIIERRPDLVCFVHFGEDQRPGDIDTPEDYANVSKP